MRLSNALGRLFRGNREAVVTDPEIGAIIQELDDWLAREHELVADGVGSMARSVPDLLRNFAQRCQKVAVVGSRRRGDANPGDLDVLYIPKAKTQVVEFLEAVADDEQLLSRGEGAWRCTVHGLPVDFIESSPERWGMDMVFFTGPRDFSERVRRHATRRGYEIDKGLPSVRKEGTYTSYGVPAFSGWSEQKILTYLGLESFLDPYKRGEG